VDRSDAAPDATALAVLLTIEIQGIKREMTRRGHIGQAARIERQMARLMRSPEWWRRQRAAESAVPISSDSTRRQREVVRMPRCAKGRRASRKRRTIGSRC